MPGTTAAVKVIESPIVADGSDATTDVVVGSFVIASAWLSDAAVYALVPA
jgi:hypothetical protein